MIACKGHVYTENREIRFRKNRFTRKKKKLFARYTQMSFYSLNDLDLVEHRKMRIVYFYFRLILFSSQSIRNRIEYFMR